MTRKQVPFFCFIIVFLATCARPGSKAVQSPRADEPKNNETVEQAPKDAGGGSNVGNGGSGIVCRTGNEINSIQLFDFYEAKILRGWEPNLAATPDQSKTIFEQALDTAQFMVDTRWKSIDPVMATYLTERLKSLPSEVIFVDQPLPLQDDVAAVINAPVGCRREQIVIASEPYLAQRRYTVRKKYFEHPNFSNLDRAGLILHELLYRLTISNGAKTSRGARYINAVLFADKQNETLVPLEHYFALMKEAEFPWGGAHGVPVYLEGYTFRSFFGDGEVGNLLTGTVVPDALTGTVFGPQHIACETSFQTDGTVYKTFISRWSKFKTAIPGLGEITGYGSLFDVGAGSLFELEDGRMVGKLIGDSVAWELPYNAVSRTCSSAMGIQKSFVERGYINGIWTVDIPLIKTIYLQFKTPLYSVWAGINTGMKFEWVEDEPAKYGGSGKGVITFASGDKCDLNSAFNLFSSGRKGLIERCAARVVPGGPWIKFEGGFREVDDGYVFDLDRFSDTEYTHAAGSHKVNLTLQAGSTVVFDNQARLRGARLGKDAVICSVSGGMRLFLGNSSVLFDENGCARNY